MEVGARARKILIHYTALGRGGAENSLLRLMAGLVRRGCEVHLVLTVPGGELEHAVDPRVDIHHLRRVRPGRNDGGPWLRRILDMPAWLFRWGIGRLQEEVAKWRFRRMHFDVAIVGRAGMPHQFVCETVKARMRIVFVRSDPAVDDTGRWLARIRRYHGKVDRYVCVSRYVQDAMGERFPEVAGKLTTIYNLIEPDRMLAMAANRPDPFGESNGALRVLSVCRLQDRQKALLRMVQVHRRLLDEGIDHVWHVLGNGPDRQLLEQGIDSLGVRSTFVLHGAVANPFAYYRNADVVAVLSRYEGLCGVVNEARVLERPVVATRFSGIEEQIVSGVSGVIVEQDVESIVDGMSLVLRSPNFREKIATGGYPRELICDSEKLDRLLSLIDDGIAR